MAFNVNELHGELARAGIMRNNHFLVEFPMPLSLRQNVTGKALLSDTNRVLSLYAEGCNLPGVALMTEEVRRYGYGAYEKFPHTPVFTDMTATLRENAYGHISAFMQAWIKAAICFENRETLNTRSGPVLNQYPMEVGYKYDSKNGEGYATDVRIRMFNEAGEETVAIVLKDAFPIFVGDIPLNWNARSDYVRVPVTFTFSSWYNEKVETQNTGNASQPVPNASVVPTAPL
jgi:hypothetical protein